MDQRIANIEADVTQLKGNVLRLNEKIDGVKDTLSELRLETQKSFVKLSLWALILYIVMGTGLLVVAMAKGFGWIK